MSTNRVSRIAYYVLRFTPILFFVASLALYIRTACPTLGGAFDSEEFQHVAYTLGIAHATGYPLYLLLGKIFTTLVPIGNIAYRMNLLSAVITAFAVVMVYLNAKQLTRGYIASVATAILFATNTAVWRQAGVASIGPLHLLLLNAILYALLRWSDMSLRGASFATKQSPNPDSEIASSQSFRAPRNHMTLSVAAFLFGLGLAHHRTTLMFAPAIAILVLLVDPGILRRPREIAKNILWLVLPLALYLYLPLFGNNSPWYSNTWQGLLAQVSGGEAGDFLRLTLPQILDGITVVSGYLFDSFGYLGGILILVGTLFAFINRKSQAESRKLLFLSLAALTYSIWGTLYAGEPDRYLVLPFAFLIYWFAIGAFVIELFVGIILTILFEDEHYRVTPKYFYTRYLVMTILLFLFALPVVLTFSSRFRIADWSAFDRVYKQWDEIFTLPIPNGAAIVGNWGQLNAMRYMQRVENRRPDLQFVGTLYDPEPQTQAAQNVLPEGGTLFLAPGIAQPNGDYRYAQLGPLLEVRAQPQMTASIAQKNIAINSSLLLANYEITTALEPYAPMKSIAPTRTARVALTWRANDALKDFIVRVNVYDPDGRLIARKDEAPVRGLYSATQWQRGEYVSDVHNLQIPGGTPPGTYSLKMQTLDAQTKSATSNEILLGTFVVERATNPAHDQVFIAHSLSPDWRDGRIELLGYGGLEGTYRASETISVSLVYMMREKVSTDLVVWVDLFDSSNKFVMRWQRAPISFYPTSEWQKGEILKAYYDLPLPNEMPLGEYSLTVTIDSNQATISKIKIIP